METEKNEILCVRTNNGEFISQIHAEILDEETLFSLMIRAFEMGMTLDVHYDYFEDSGEKFAWCYKNDINELMSCLQ